MTPQRTLQARCGAVMEITLSHGHSGGAAVACECRRGWGRGPHRWHRRMRERSIHLVALKSSSVSIFHVTYRASSAAAASWSKPCDRSCTLAAAAHRRLIVVTRCRHVPS